MRRQTKHFVGVLIFMLAGFTSTTSGVFAASKAAIVLSGNAVGTIHFGESQGTAVPALRKLIGAAGSKLENAKGNCTIDTSLYWTNFAVYFFHGKFVGYQTGSVTGKPASAFSGVTPLGLRGGDSLATAQKLYPGAVTTRGVNGGVYAIVTKTGTLRGYLSMEVMNSPSKIRLMTISAGSIGCPADSPG